MFINVQWMRKNLEQSGASVSRNSMKRPIKVTEYLNGDSEDAEEDLNRADEGALSSPTFSHAQATRIASQGRTIAFW